jgi:hypothetical protein
MRCHIQLQVRAPGFTTPSASMYRRCIGSSNCDIKPRRAFALQLMTENIFGHAAMILNYRHTSGKLAVQLAAKKKQSINSSCVASVLRCHRK